MCVMLMMRKRFLMCDHVWAWNGSYKVLVCEICGVKHDFD
jgi:hypothetical protein